MDYSPWFDFWSSKKVLREVYHLKGNEKRNLMALVSVAQHLRVGSYERFSVSKSTAVTTFTSRVC